MVPAGCDRNSGCRVEVARVRVLLRLVVALGLLTPAFAGAGEAGAATDPFPGCTTDTTVVVGTVSCRLIDSADVGGRIPFSYLVPPGCAPAAGRPCPVLYLLHGFG